MPASGGTDGRPDGGTRTPIVRSLNVINTTPRTQQAAAAPCAPAQGRGAALILLLLVAVTAFTGCRRRSSERKPPPPAPAVEPAPDEPAAIDLVSTEPLPPAPPPPAGHESHGSLRIHAESEPADLDPLADDNQLVARITFKTIYEPLLECGREGYVGRLADTWEVSSDGLRVTLHLRPGVHWSDGRPFVPPDVQATFERLLRANGPSPALRALFDDVEAVEIAPDRTVRLRLARPSGFVLRALCELPILPEPLLRGGKAGLSSLARQPVGTGPYRLATWERGKRIRLQRDPGAATPARLAELDFEIDGDFARALARARRDELDVLPRVPETMIPEQVAGPVVRQKLHVLRLEPDRYSLLIVNHRRELMSDARVRRALSLGWDRAGLSSELRRGLARPLGAPPWAPLPSPVFDPKGAAALFEQAGLRDTDGDGVRDRNGAAVRITLLVVSGAKTLGQEARRYALNLRRAGVLLDLAVVDAATFQQRLQKGEFDLAPLLWEGMPDEDPRPQFARDGRFNYGAFRSDRVDALLDELRAALTPGARAPLLERLGQAMSDEQDIIPLYRHDAVALVSRRVHDLGGVGDRFDWRSAWVDAP